MKNFKKIFFSGKEKVDTKVKRSLENGIGAEYLTAVLGESKSSTFIDLPQVGLAISNSYLISYYLFVRKELSIIKLSDIVNVYSSNCFYGTYDFSWKAIAIETNDGMVCYLSTCAKNRKVNQFNEAIEILKKRCRENEGSIIA